MLKERPRVQPTIFETSHSARLAVIQRARQTGFTLDEIRELFFGFHNVTPPGNRWRKMSERKLAELEASVDHIKTMQRLLQRLQDCNCDALKECGKRLLRQECTEVPAKSLSRNQRGSLKTRKETIAALKALPGQENNGSLIAERHPAHR